MQDDDEPQSLPIGPSHETPAPASWSSPIVFGCCVGVFALATIWTLRAPAPNGPAHAVWTNPALHREPECSTLFFRDEVRLLELQIDRIEAKLTPAPCTIDAVEDEGDDDFPQRPLDEVRPRH